ncbi:hypothetical protein D3C86_1864090 [compost metagenome]
MNNCIAPNANANAPANSPSACAERPNSACSPVAMMAVMVRNAWLSAKPEISASSMVHAVRLGKAAKCGGVKEPESGALGGGTGKR